MATTGGDLDLSKPAVSDEITGTIAEYAGNFQKIDDGFSEHVAESVQDAGGVHGLVVEEGTWTPELKFGGFSTGITYATQMGTYIKIGNVLHFQYRIVISSKGSATGNATVSGLPVAKKAGSQASKIPKNMTNGITLPANYTNLEGHLASSSTEFSVRASGSAQAEVTLTDTAFVDGFLLDCQGFYFV